MPLPSEKLYTAEDYWNLPDQERAELIHGKLYAMAPPKRIHQEISMGLSSFFSTFIREHGGKCRVYAAPFAVNLDADDEIYVEPDLCIVCDSKKLTEKGCKGAPDLVVEIVSDGSRRMDYSTKNTLYSDAGVREYWIIDPAKQRSTVYCYEEDAAPLIIPFDQPIVSHIFGGMRVVVKDLAPKT